MYLSDGTLLQGGRYKIVRFISSGGFGCTYEAEHVLLHKKVAIKEFFVKDFCNRDETTSQVSIGITSKTALVAKLKDKFIVEAQSLCVLEHPNIVHVFDVFEENGTAYYVMDYINGLSLNDIVKKEGPLNEEKAVGYIKQIADALGFVHSQNRLHLDIKPGNIMVDENDKAVLIDFGASKQYDEVGGENTSTLVGKTPGYAPLEQMGNDVVKFLPSTDIYALGATLYKLLTGITPPSATLLASGETLDAMPSSVSADTRNAVLQSMQINKMKRPQSMDEFQKLLDNSDSTIIDTLPSVPPTPVPPVSVPPVQPGGQTSSPQKRKSSSKKGVLAVILAVFLVGYFIFGGTSTDEQMVDGEQVTDSITSGEHVAGQVFKDAGGMKYTYTGEVVDGKPNGKGTGIYTYGTYSGDYINGLRHGKGTFVSKDGSNEYEGTFANDKYNEGKLTMTVDKSFFKGTFRKGKPYNGKWYNKDGTVMVNVVNGKEAIQTTQQSPSSLKKSSKKQKAENVKPKEETEETQSESEFEIRGNEYFH